MDIYKFGASFSKPVGFKDGFGEAGMRAGLAKPNIFALMPTLDKVWESISVLWVKLEGFGIREKRLPLKKSYSNN